MTLTILFLWIQNLHAQTMQDSVFNNVIIIKKEDVTKNGYDFLIEIPIKTKKRTIIIFNNDELIPAKLFFDRKSFLFQQNRILLITPDWAYYKNVRQSERSDFHPRPIMQNKFYLITRNDTTYKVDSLIVRMDEPKKTITLNFIRPELKKNEVGYFFQECYGSICCPEDLNWKFKQERDKMKNNFNEKYNVNIDKNIYEKVLEKDGAHCIYYTLTDLTNEQKIAFFRTQKLLPNSQVKDTDLSPIIILPNIINTNNLTHKN